MYFWKYSTYWYIISHHTLISEEEMICGHSLRSCSKTEGSFNVTANTVNKWQYLRNSARHWHGYYRSLIGNNTQLIKFHHWWWPWVTLKVIWAILSQNKGNSLFSCNFIWNSGRHAFRFLVAPNMLLSKCDHRSTSAAGHYHRQEREFQNNVVIHHTA